MTLDTKSLKAVIFDYGNTLIEFARPQIVACDTALANTLAKHFGPADLEKLQAIRNRDRVAPYTPPEYKENNMVEISTNLVRELYGVEPSQEQLADVLRTRFEAFVRVVKAEPHAFEVLKYLRKKKYKLGLLSNYPDADAIRETLKRTGIDEYLDAAVISGDLGVVKPHPLPYQVVLEELKVKAHQAVLVGDNWLGDIQGAKQARLQAIFITQWETPEKFPKEDHHVEPDAVIGHLEELVDLL